jgi:hypothetical protein
VLPPGGLQIRTLHVLGSGFLKRECFLIEQWPIDYLVWVVQQNLGAGDH